MADDSDSLKLPAFEALFPTRPPAPAPKPVPEPAPARQAVAPPAQAPEPAPPAPPTPPSLPPRSRVSARPAAEVARHSRLSPAALALLRDGMSTRSFLDALTQKRLFADALRLLAQALPKREAVWWACQCTREVHGASPTPAAVAALEAAERWAARPSDEHRATAWAAAEAADVGTPAGCAAAAAHWSGGRDDAASVPLTARAVAGSVLMAAVLQEPEQFAERASRFLALGVAAASGASRWKATGRKG